MGRNQEQVVEIHGRYQEKLKKELKVIASVDRWGMAWLGAKD